MGHPSLRRRKDRARPGIVSRSALLAASVALLGALVPATAQAARTAGLPRPLPLSPGFLAAMAYRTGVLQPGAAAASRGEPRAASITNRQISPPDPGPSDTAGIVDDGARLQAGLNRVAVPYRDFNCNALVAIDTSDDRGQSFRHHCLEAPAGLFGYGGARAVYGVDPSNVDAYAFGAFASSAGRNGAIVLQKTTDNGVTWQAPTVVMSASGGTLDAPSATVDPSPASPMFGRLYASATQLDATYSHTQIMVARSSDHGATWTTSSPAPQATFPTVQTFSDLAVGPGGILYVSWFQCTAGGPTGDCGGQAATIKVARSNDGGATWSPPVNAQVYSAPPDTNGDFFGTLPGTDEPLTDIPAIAVNQSNGFVSFDATNFDGTRVQMRVTHSSDGGITWSPPVGVTPPSNLDDQFLGWLSISPKGLLIASWMSRHADHEYRAAMALSFDGGTTWRDLPPIASQTSNMLNDGFGGHYMGDSTGNTADGKCILQVWTDTRFGKAVIELGFVSNDALNCV